MQRKLCLKWFFIAFFAVLLAFLSLNVAFASNMSNSSTHRLHILVVGEGSTEPKPGTYTFSYGSKIRVKAIPREGYIFYQWELDGVRIGSPDSPTITVTMNEDHNLRALFVKESLTSSLKKAVRELPKFPPSVGDSSISYSMLDDFPTGFYYDAGNIDVAFNKGELSLFSGMLVGGNKGHLIVIGGPKVMPFRWEEYDIDFNACGVTVGGKEYAAVYGEKDYAVILIDYENDAIRVAGITRYGTRAGLLWLLDNYPYLRGKSLLVVEWMDINSNREVELWEVSLVQIPF